MTQALTRRQFLKLSTTAVGSALVMSGIQSVLSTPEVHADEGTLITSQNDVIVPGVCHLCPSGCGIISRVADGYVVKLEGSPMHPINTGALCPKGQAAPELLYNPDRLTKPLRRNGNKWQAITWDDAIQEVADRFTQIRADGRPEQSALMVGEAPGQLDSFFARFMRVMGSSNYITRESLNVAATKLAMYLTQGIYDMPAYDIENSAYILSFGSSFLEAGPVPQRMISGFAYLRQGRATRGKVVVVDPRQGVTGAKADEWIPIKPGTDGALALGMAHVIIRSSMMDPSFVNNYTFGFEDFPDETNTKLLQGFKNYVLENYSPDKVEEITGVSATTIARLAGEFASNRPAVALLPGKGGLLNGTFGGVYAAMAVHMLNALVGSIDAPGGVMVQRYPHTRPWPTLQPDAIADQGCRVRRLDGAGWRFPLARNAYQAVADRILSGNPLEILLLHEANPVYETPGGDRFIKALDEVPFVVSFSSFMDETAEHADLVLPLPTFMERYEDQYMEGLGYPGVGLRQPVIPPQFNTMSIGDFLLRVADKMGGSVANAFPWATYEEVLQYRLAEMGGSWDSLAELGVWMFPGYRFARRGSEKWVKEIVGPDRRYAPRDGYFDFFSRELHCILGRFDEAQLADWGLTTDYTASMPQYQPTEFVGEEDKYPFMLNVVTLMSLGPYSPAANMPTLQEISGMTVNETWDSWVEMNPEAAEEHHLHDGDIVWVESPYGKVRTKLRYVSALRPDVVNLPHNQGHTAVGRWAKDRGVNGLAILSPKSEPVTGLASFTNTRVKVYK